MKRSFLLFVVIIFNINCLFCQKDTTFIKTQFDGDIYHYVGSRITYPWEMISNNIEGTSVVAFRLNKKGKIDSINVEKFPIEKCADNAVDILIETKNMWSPTLKNNEPIDFIYKIVINYKNIGSDKPNRKRKSVILKEKAEEKVEKGQFEKALSLINKAIALSPYDSGFYKIRSLIHNSLNNSVQSELDNKLAKKYDEEIIAIIDIVSYKMKR